MELHHIDGDHDNNARGNLAVLCRNCHGLVTRTGSLGKNYAPGEVVHYKADWEKECAEDEDEDIESPVEAFHETKVIDGHSHESYCFDMEEGDELVFAFEANDCLDIVVCDEEDLEEWEGKSSYEEHDLPENYWSSTKVIEGNYTFEAPESGSYALLLVNWDEEETEVSVDVSLWEAE